MTESTRFRMERLEELSKQDVEYVRLSNQMRSLEQKYNAVLGQLSWREQNIICDFVSQCEEMSWRMLELACTFMRFPPETAG